MKAAFAHWDNRIAPVFDTARRVDVVEVEFGRVISERGEDLLDDSPIQKVLRLADLGIDTLVCGAISRSLHGMVSAYGIRVISFVAGDLNEVIQAWQAGTLDRDVFAMPGCCGRGRRRFGGVNDGLREEFVMNGRGRGRGAGGGLGGGIGGGQGRGVGPTGFCFCPQCGRKEPHQPGVPCVKRNCPECGTAMIRE